MITFIDIRNAITKRLYQNFPNIDIVVENTVNVFDQAMFYVNVKPSQSKIYTQTSNMKYVTVEINYFDTDRDDLYITLDQLLNLFQRTIQVDYRYLHFKDIEYRLVKDSVAEFLQLELYIEYVEDVKDEVFEDLNDYDYMQTVNIDYKLKGE